MIGFCDQKKKMSHFLCWFSFLCFGGFVFLSDVASVLVDLFHVGRMRSDKRMEGLPVSDSVPSFGQCCDERWADSLGGNWCSRLR